MNHSQPIAVQWMHDVDSGVLFREELQILYVLRGTVSAEVGSKHNQLTYGGMLLIEPFIHHRIDCLSGSIVLLQVSRDMLQLTGSFQAGKFKCFVADDSSGKKGEYDLLRMHFARLFKLYSQDAGQDATRLIASTSQLLSVLVEHFANPAQNGLRSEEWDGNYDRYVRIMEFIHENWREPITIKQIAKREFLSEGYLSRFFKQHVGATLTEYLTELRLQNAARDLAGNKGSVTDVALANGFKSVNYFIETFKRQFGETPNQYRHHMQNRMRNLQGMQVELSIQEGVNHLLQYAEIEKLSTSVTAVPGEHRQITAHVDQDGKRLRHTWRKLLNIGYARDGLLAEVQTQLRIAQEEVGFEYLRFHGILDDDMHIYHEDEQQKPFLDFSRVDLLLDFILSIGLKPYIELSYMPALLAQEEQHIFDRLSLLSMYRDEQKWRFLVCGLAQHCVERYGREQVRSWRITTIGNNLVSAGLLKQADFLEIYRTAYESVKSVDPLLLFGGPGGMASSIWDDQYIHEFLDYAVEHACVPDFISTQCYPHRSVEQDKDFLVFTRSQESAPTVLSGDEHYTKTVLNDYHKLLKSHGLGHLKIWVEEWNSTLWQRDLSNDTCYKSSWLAANLCDTYDNAEAFGYWLLTDFIEERSAFGNVFHGGYGLFTYNSIPKSGWRALQLIRMLGDRLIAAGEGWMVTKSPDGIQIVLTHYCHYEKLYRFRYHRLTDAKEAYSVFVKKGMMNYTVQLAGMTPGRYEIRKYSVSRMQGSPFDAWLEIGAPKYLRQNEIKYLKNASQPKYHIQTQEIGERYLLESTLEPHEIQLIQLRSVEML